MSGHTPTPWAIADGEGCERIVVGHGTSNILFVLREPYGRAPIPQDADIPANAAFIVKAVNNHDAMLLALKEVRVVSQFELDQPTEMRDVAFAKLKRLADAALKAATGERE